MTMPNFLVIGAAKSGTDALCNYLGHHPDVYMCPNREPNFFVAEGQDNVPYRGPGDRAWLEPAMWTSTLERYQSLFSGVTREHAIGEGTADYLYSEDAPARIQRYIPEAKLIAVLRNPVDRAYSAYSMLLGSGREPITTFSEALAAENERRRQNWEPIWHYVKMGFYASQLKRYYQVFDPTQVRVVLYDDLDARPGDVLRDLFGFLGVDAGFTLDTSTRHNVSLVPRNRTVHALAVGHFLPRTALKALIPGRVRRSLQHRVVERNLVRPPPVEPEIRHQLVEVYRSDIIELGAILGRDLTAWLR
jgi:hypothetical protein